jgi:hypothetical protein
LDEESSGRLLLGVLGGDDLVVHHNHRSDRHFAGLQSSLRNCQRHTHEPLVVIAHEPILTLLEVGTGARSPGRCATVRRHGDTR